MLFGRKKPGFIKIEEKPELLEYLASLPDAEDEFAGLAETERLKELEAEKETAQVKEPEREVSEAEKLADYIRIRSGTGRLTAYASLKEEIEDTDRLLEEMKTEEYGKDVACREGQKDRYFYSRLNMSDNYAMIASLVEDKDLAATIAHMVRFNSKTYPAPTPLSYFERHPYYATPPQIERAWGVISGEEAFGDIERFTNNRNTDFLFSTQFLTPKYAKALAHADEFTD